MSRLLFLYCAIYMAVGGFLFYKALFFENYLVAVVIVVGVGYCLWLLLDSDI